MIIPAAGSGSRMKAGKNKMFIHLSGHPVLVHTLLNIVSLNEVNRIIMPIKSEEKSFIDNLLVPFPSIQSKLVMVEGGKERCDSVRNALRFIWENQPSELVMVHDGARPLITSKLLKKLNSATQEMGAAIPVLPVPETVRRVDEDQVEVVDRSKLFLTQTPQSFKASYIPECFLSEAACRLELTDDASYIERQGHPVFRLEGDKCNIKITHPDDLEIAEFWLKKIPFPSSGSTDV